MRYDKLMWVVCGILIALLTVKSAKAETVAASSNTGGGQIMLTDMSGTCPSGSKVAFSRVTGGAAIMGCWTANDEWIFVRWSDGDFRMYDPRNFQMQGKYAKPKGTAL